MGVKIGLHRPFFRVQAAKNAAFRGHNAANVGALNAPNCASIRNFAENRLLTYICLLQSQKRFLATSANKAFAINRPVRFSPLLRSGVGKLAKADTKNGQDFRLAQSAQAISSSLFNLNTSQMSLIRS